MEQAQNSMYELVKDISSRVREYMALAKIESLRYPSFQQQLQNASRSLSIFREGYEHLEELVSSLGKENPRVIARAEKVAKLANVVATRLDRIGSKYQGRLDEKVVEYSKQMDEQYGAFYRHIVDNLLSNIRKGDVAVPDKGPMDTTHPRNPKIIEGYEGPYNWAKLLIEGTLPSDNFEACRKIMDEYDRLLNEAQKLWEATKDTTLNTSGLYAVLFQHRVLFTDEKGTPHAGGKRGKINLEFSMMRIFASKGGLFDIKSASF